MSPFRLPGFFAFVCVVAWVAIRTYAVHAQAGGGLVSTKVELVSDGLSRSVIPLGFLGVTYSHGPDKIKLAMNSPDWESVGDRIASE